MAIAFRPLPTPVEMAQWDRAAMELGLPEMVLMENAAREALHALTGRWGSLAGQRILLFMGSGNNGGDAACLSRHLLDAGAKVLVLHSRPLAAYRGVTGQHLRLARKCGVPFRLAASWPTRFAASSWMRPHIVVDGLLGTGFSGIVRPFERELIQHINALREQAFILALDIPSGLSGFSGQPRPEAVRAHMTVTFEAAKPGLVLPEAAPWVGQLHVRPIGIPALVRTRHPASFQLMTPGVVQNLPRPDPHWHKGRAGHVLIVGGSPGLTGAPRLAALGALHTGAGLVTIATPRCCVDSAIGNCPDLMSLPLRGKDNASDLWHESQCEELRPLLQRVSALVIGPGMGRAPETALFVKALLQMEERPPAVVDADALYALASLAPFPLKPDDVLTPHPGEAAFLLHKPSATVQADRFVALRQLLALAPAVWILKGAGTLIGASGHPTTLSPHAVPNLAVGGSGDVLAGIIGTLLAQHSCSFEAACAAVLLHAEAGRQLGEMFPLRGNSASQIAAALPRARAALSSNPDDPKPPVMNEY